MTPNDTHLFVFVPLCNPFPVSLGWTNNLLITNRTCKREGALLEIRSLKTDFHLSHALLFFSLALMKQAAVLCAALWRNQGARNWGHHHLTAYEELNPVNTKPTSLEVDPSPGKPPEDRSPSQHLDLQSVRDLQWKSPVWSCQDSWPTEIFDAYYLKMLSSGWIAMQQLITNTQDASLSSLCSILIGILICTYRQPCTVHISQTKGWSSEKWRDVSGRLGHRAGKYRARRQIQVCLTYQTQMLFPLNKTALKCSWGQWLTR